MAKMRPPMLRFGSGSGSGSKDLFEAPYSAMHPAPNLSPLGQSGSLELGLFGKRRTPTSGGDSVAPLPKERTRISVLDVLHRWTHRPTGSLVDDTATYTGYTDGHLFNSITGLVIIWNAIAIGIETDYDVDFVGTNALFTLCFFVEVCLRLRDKGWNAYFFTHSNATNINAHATSEASAMDRALQCLRACSSKVYLLHWWHIVDVGLLLSGISDLFILYWVHSRHQQQDSELQGMLQCSRIIRIVRVVRLFRMFNHLKVVLQAFYKSATFVTWIGLFTVVLNYLFAVILTRLIGHHADRWEQFGEEERIKLWFGNITSSMRTLFFVMTLAEWDEIILVLCQYYRPGVIPLLCFVLYIAFVSYAMMSLITGVICDSLSTAKSDDEECQRELYAERKDAVLHGVRRIVSERLSAVVRQNGTITHDQFREALLPVDNVSSEVSGLNSEDKRAELLEDLASLDVYVTEDQLLLIIEEIAEPTRGGKSSDQEVDLDTLIATFALVLMRSSGSSGASTVCDLWYIAHSLQNQMLELKERQAEGRVSVEKLNATIRRLPTQRDVKELHSKLDNLAAKIDLVCTAFSHAKGGA